MRPFSIVSLLILITISAFPQSNQGNYKTEKNKEVWNYNSFDFLPSGQLLPPFKANMQDMKFGIAYHPDNGDLKIDMGNQVDCFSFTSEDKSQRVVIGAEFGAYAKIMDYKYYRLQVGTLDGFFGGYISYKKILDDKNNFIGRARYMHRSAHLVDGEYDYDTRFWVGNNEPVPFANDYFDFLIGTESRLKTLFVRTYLSVDFLTLYRPKNQEKLWGYGGVEAYCTNLSWQFLNKEFTPYLAYQGTLVGVDSYGMNNQIQAGIQAGDPTNKAFTLYAFYYTGYHFYGEYFSEKMHLIGIGFTLDFP